MGIEETGPGLIGITARDRTREQFVQEMLDICGDVRLFALAQSGDTTSTTGKSRGEKVVTWSKSLAAFDTPVNTLGEGYAWTFDGVDEEGDTPDTDDLSFGDGASDNPGSWLALVNQATAEAAVIIAKEASASDEEWSLETDAAGKPQLVLTDESASATIGRKDNTALSGNALVGATYDGNKLASGISVYLNGVATDDTDVVAATYVAMEAGASKVQIAHHYSTPALFFTGSIGFVLVTGKELNADEMWQVKTLVNWYYNLSL